MRFKEYLQESFFKNLFTIEDSELEKLSMYYGKNWETSGNVKTMHDGEDHLFTYNIKNKELMTDKSKAELLKIIKF